jgi:serine/threonine protein kinase
LKKKQEFYLVQEYVQGHPLSDELPVDKRVPEAQVVDLLKGVLRNSDFYPRTQRYSPGYQTQ